jgi:uncharacterized protein
VIASTRHTAILLAILAAITIAAYAANTNRSSSTRVNRVVLYSSIVIGELFLARYTIAGLQTVSLRELVGTIRWFDVPLAAAFWFASRLLLVGMQRALGTTPNRVSGLTPVTTPEKIAWVAASLTAGFVEELVFRGYLQRQFAAWTRNALAGIGIQAVIFGVSHSYQGVKPAITITIYGVLFGLLAHYRRSLVPGMLAHAATDVIGGLLQR